MVLCFFSQVSLRLTQLFSHKEYCSLNKNFTKMFRSLLHLFPYTTGHPPCIVKKSLRPFFFKLGQNKTEPLLAFETIPSLGKAVPPPNSTSVS